MVEKGGILGRYLVDLFRLNRPTGAFFLYIPCLWGLLLASKGHPNLKDVFLFFGGAVLMRGVGCAYNDWVDRDLDAQVARTQSRPFARGALSLKVVVPVAILFLCMALWILTQLSQEAIYVGLLCFIAIFPYPWLKRVTFWPQLYLGFIFSSGIWLAWFHVRKDIDTIALFWLYGAGVVWTLYYDTIYGYQDWEHDRQAGVKSLPLFLGPRPQVFLALSALCVLGVLFMVGLSESLSVYYFVGLVLVGLHFVWQWVRLDVNNPEGCMAIFVANAQVGALVSLSLLAGFLM